MLPVISRSLAVFALFTCSSYASGSSCTNLCPGLFDTGKCCDDEFQFPTLMDTHDTERDGFQTIDMWTIFIGFSSLLGVIFVILIICSCCPCCILYKRRKNGTIYRRFGGGDTPPGRKKKGIFNKGVRKTKHSVPAINQTPSVTVIASHPVQMNFPQSCAPQQIMGHTGGYLPHSQAAMQSPPPCTVAVICDSHHRQPAYNPMYRQ